jgi:hypothetical protein
MATKLEEAMKKPFHMAFLEPFHKALQDQGMTPEQAAKDLIDLAKANTNKASYDKTSGKWVYSKDLEALDIRLQANNTLLHIFNLFPPKKQEVTGENGEKFTLVIDTGRKEEDE